MNGGASVEWTGDSRFDTEMERSKTAPVKGGNSYSTIRMGRGAAIDHDLAHGMQITISKPKKCEINQSNAIMG